MATRKSPRKKVREEPEDSDASGGSEVMRARRDEVEMMPPPACSS